MRRRFADLASSVFAALCVVLFALGCAPSSSYVGAAEPLSNLCKELYSSCPLRSDYLCEYPMYCNGDILECHCHDVVDPHDGLEKCTCVEAPL